jgi:hypothetical protein
VLLKVVEKGRPVQLQPMGLEIAQGEGKGVVDTDDGRHILG